MWSLTHHAPSRLKLNTREVGGQYYILCPSLLQHPNMSDGLSGALLHSQCIATDSIEGAARFVYRCLSSPKPCCPDLQKATLCLQCHHTHVGLVLHPTNHPGHHKNPQNVRFMVRYGC